MHMPSDLGQRTARALLVALAASHCVYASVSAEEDEEFAVEPGNTAPPPPQEKSPEDDFFEYMGYLNKAVPVLGFALVLFIYFGMGWLEKKTTAVKGPKVHVSHILVKEEIEADTLRKQIKSSAKKTKTFAELAAKNSSCPSNSKGGHMGVFGKGQMMPEFDKIVFTEPVGSVHVVRTKFGWHVLMITQRDELPGDLKRKKQ